MDETRCVPPGSSPAPLERVLPEDVARALARIGRDEGMRRRLLDDLRRAELAAPEPDEFRREVRWPLVAALLREVTDHRVRLESSLVFEIGTTSRIERALLLSRDEKPDHVWEPQTTRLLIRLAGERDAAVVVGGAYIGDQVLPVADALRGRPGGVVHAFEPMPWAFARLRRNLELNGLGNVRAFAAALGGPGTEEMILRGPPALARCTPATEARGAREAEECVRVPSVALDDHVRRARLERVGIVMLDLEGGEEEALRGAESLLRSDGAPDVVFEVHASYVDWSRGLERAAPVAFLLALGYRAFAIRDFHDNESMRGRAIEVVPVDRVVLDGPPHGFNVLATRDPALVERLDLRVVRDVSPKLLRGRDPALHHPLDGLP